jgi:hypothetical protein
MRPDDILHRHDVDRITVRRRAGLDDASVADFSGFPAAHPARGDCRLAGLENAPEDRTTGRKQPLKLGIERRVDAAPFIRPVIDAINAVNCSGVMNTRKPRRSGRHAL